MYSHWPFLRPDGKWPNVAGYVAGLVAGHGAGHGAGLSAFRVV